MATQDEKALAERDQQLIDRWIEPHPWKLGVEDARLVDSKVSAAATFAGTVMAARRS